MAVASGGCSARNVAQRELVTSDLYTTLADLTAGPAALVIAKIHKIAERVTLSPNRLVDKDAHDLYRLLIDTDTHELASKFRALLQEGVCGEVTRQALTHLKELFASGPEATGSAMAGRAETGIGEPATVAQQVAILADDLLNAINDLH